MHRPENPVQAPVASNIDTRPDESPADPIEAHQRAAPAPLITPEERRKREDAVRFANASIGLEGFEVSPESHARTERFISGEINLDELLRDQ